MVNSSSSRSYLAEYTNNRNYVSLGPIEIGVWNELAFSLTPRCSDFATKYTTAKWFTIGHKLGCCEKERNYQSYNFIIVSFAFFFVQNFFLTQNLAFVLTLLP